MANTGLTDDEVSELRSKAFRFTRKILRAWGTPSYNTITRDIADMTLAQLLHRHDNRIDLVNLGLYYRLMDVCREHVKYEVRRKHFELEAAADTVDMENGVIIKDFIIKAIRRLSFRNQKIARRLMKGFSSKEIGESLNVSETRISQLKEKLAWKMNTTQ